MSEQTVVSVFAVEAGGATGARLGSASLIARSHALVHRPLSKELATSPRPTRVGVASPSGRVEVLDVAGIVVAADAPDLVALEFEGTSSAPVDEPEIEFPGPDELGQPVDPGDAAVIAALRALLDQVDAGTPPTSPPPDDLFPGPDVPPGETIENPINWVLGPFRP